MRMITCYPKDETMQKGVCVCVFFFSKCSRSDMLLGERFGARDDVFSY